MVIWLIGMSASGKTTIGRFLYQRLSDDSKPWVFIDGDTFRNILGEDLGHTIEDRERNAYRISRLCEFLDSQGINVLACVLSLFHQNQEYNRKHISEYREVFIDVEFSKLKERDNKELYEKALKGEVTNVVGVDIEFKRPLSPDVIINNNSDDPDFDEITTKILEELSINIKNKYSYTKFNLLNKPHKYQYSKFEGELFFSKFLKDRKDSLKILTNNLDKLTYLCDEKELNYDLNFLKGKEFRLVGFLLFLMKAPKEELYINKDILNILIKRFEVSKKLFESYDDIEYRKNSNITCDNVVYAWFSNVLQNYYHNICTKQERLIYLNAILKANDILSSIRSQIITPVELRETIKALNGELVIIEEYL